METTPFNKFSKEFTPEELLNLMLIAFQISKDEDFPSLHRFVAVCAKEMGPEDFNKLLRRTIKFMGDEKCGDDLCSDWLMGKLYELYESFN